MVQLLTDISVSDYTKTKQICERAAGVLEQIGTPQALAAIETWEADRDNFNPAAFLAEWEREHGPADE